MTLADLLPSLRSSLRPQLQAGVWPSTACWGARADLVLGGVGLTPLAGTYGLPVHLLDEHDVRERCAEYVAAFGAGSVAYSADAGLSVPAGRWIAGSGIGCHLSSAAQLRTALLAGFPADRLVLRGRAKSLADLDAAYESGAAIVVGTAAELGRVAAWAPCGQRILVRVLPASAARGRAQFGWRLGSRSALEAIGAVNASRSLVFAGLDCSLGHQLSRFQTFESCLREAMAFTAVIWARCRVAVPALNLGGGHAVAYRDADDGFAVSAFASRTRAMLRLGAERHSVGQPLLTVSPGRSITARAGVTLARVVTVAATPDGIRVTLDGATGCMRGESCADRHGVQLIGRVSMAGPVSATVMDSRAARVSATYLPADLTPGDLLAVAATGAYHHGAGAGPAASPVIGVAGGEAQAHRRRITVEEMLAILA